jgi:hypothetical protein
MQQDRERKAEAVVGDHGARPDEYPVPCMEGYRQKNLSLVAGGVAYYRLLALFPALAALVSL